MESTAAPPTAAAASSASSVGSNPSTRPSTPAGPEPDAQSKIKTLVSILRRFVGVADIAQVRFSLPSQLLEPIPNLEYWNYLDRPETFASIGDKDDELERCLAVLRFWFTKDLKFVKGKPCKPYNSTLGEFFRCHWDVQDASPKPPSERPVRVSYLTEQTSHHPPVSAFYIDCEEKGVSAQGFDQISAKFTGTSIKVTPGSHNLGIYINLHKRGDEQWNLTHPAAHLGGFLRGALSITVQDVCYVTCPKLRIKVILHYLEEPWVGKSRHKLEGVVFRYNPAEDTIMRTRDVSDKDVLARIEGSWVSQLYYTLPGSKEKHLIIDLDPLFPATKICPTDDEMLPNESRRVWAQVTNAINMREYNKATDLKVEVEEQKRKEAAERQERNEEWEPKYFDVSKPGLPSLTQSGRELLGQINAGFVRT